MCQLFRIKLVLFWANLLTHFFDSPLGIPVNWVLCVSGSVLYTVQVMAVSVTLRHAAVTTWHFNDPVPTSKGKGFWCQSTSTTHHDKTDIRLTILISCIFGKVEFQNALYTYHYNLVICFAAYNIFNQCCLYWQFSTVRQILSNRKF